MRSLGVDLARWVKRGLLTIHAQRPTAHGLEMHLVALHKSIDELRPRMVIIDPMTTFGAAGSLSETHGILVRIIDFLKGRGVTAVYTAVTSPTRELDDVQVQLSSLMDTWILLGQADADGALARTLFVLKSRGMDHSHDVREFRLTKRGIQLGGHYPTLNHRMESSRGQG
jgi:circadian clock protein KaiC